LVKLDSVIYTASTNIETLPDSSNIKIIGECNIENRTIEINGTPSLKVINGNPIEGTANIDFTIMSDELTTINLFNSLGEKILVVVNQNLKAGSYYATFDSKGLPSGNYFLTLENGINLLIVPISLIH